MIYLLLLLALLSAGALPVAIAQPVASSPDELSIIEPAENQPDYVGPYNYPGKFDAKIELHLSPGLVANLTAGDFRGVIFNASSSGPIKVLAAIPIAQNRYILVIDPPSDQQGISDNGTYNLRLEIPLMDLNNTADNSIVYSEETRVDVIEVIDKSGSMARIGSGGETYMELAKRAAKLFVDQLQPDDQIGVVDFNHEVTVTYPLTMVDPAGTVKEAAKAAIDTLTAGGSTSIGGGLETGQQELDNGGLANHCWAMVLLSDGYENTSPMWADVESEIVAAKTNVYTIGLGPDTDERLMNKIALKTGGTYYNLPDPTAADLQRIYQWVSARITGQEIIFSDSGQIQPGDSDSWVVNVDSTSRMAMFQITWSTPSAALQLTLEDPNGQPYDETHSEYAAGDTHQYYIIEYPAAGAWHMFISASSGSPPLRTTAELYHALATARTKLNLHAYLDYTHSFTGQLIKLFGFPSDTDPICSATLTAEIEPPADESQSSIVLELYDDGGHCDGLAGDGIFANVFQPAVEGTYKFTLSATGTSNLGELFFRQKTLSAYVLPTTGPLMTVEPQDLYMKGQIGAIISETITLTEPSGAQEITELYAHITELSGLKDGIPTSNITLSMTSQSIPAGGSIPLTVIVDIPSYLEPGLYHGSLYITGSVGSFIVPIKLHAVRFIGTPDVEIERIELNSAWLVDASGYYSGQFYNSIVQADCSIEYTICQDVRSKLEFISGLITPLSDPTQISTFTMRGRLKFTGDGFVIKARGRGVDGRGQRFKISATGSIEDDILVLRFCYKTGGSRHKSEFDIVRQVANPNIKATIRFDTLIARGKKRKNLAGTGFVFFPYGSQRIRIKEKIKEVKNAGTIRRNYAIKGENLRFTINTTMNSWNELYLTVTESKGKIGYGKIPVRPADLTLDYFYQIERR